MTEPYVPYSEISSKLDLKAGDTLLVASDITRLTIDALKNKMRFEPDKFIDSLLERVSNGTLLFPAFVNNLSDGGTFDIAHTLPQTGALSMAAFKRIDFIRTSDPFHSFMVKGKHAEALQAIKNKSTFGDDSVFAFLHQHTAKMLLIDIDLQHSFTFAHYVEEREGARYRELKKQFITCIDKNSKVSIREISFFEKKPGVMIALNGLHDLFLKKGASTETRINGSVFTLIDLNKAYELIKNDIHSNGGSNLHKMSISLFAKTMIKKIIP